MNKGKFKATPRHKYPHLLPGDSAIWERFLKSPLNTFDSLDYDFHVGDGVDINIKNYLPNMQKMAKKLSQLRIDVVAYTGNDIWIIEVKPWPGVGAIGQLICYRDLYLRQEKATNVNLMLVCNTLSKDLDYCARMNFILPAII